MSAPVQKPTMELQYHGARAQSFWKAIASKWVSLKCIVSSLTAVCTYSMFSALKLQCNSYLISDHITESITWWTRCFRPFFAHLCAALCMYWWGLIFIKYLQHIVLIIKCIKSIYHLLFICLQIFFFFWQISIQLHHLEILT